MSMIIVCPRLGGVPIRHWKECGGDAPRPHYDPQGHRLLHLHRQSAQQCSAEQHSVEAVLRGLPASVLYGERYDAVPGESLIYFEMIDSCSIVVVV